MTQKFKIAARLKSFRFAFNGLRTLLQEEHNTRVHLFVSVLVGILALVLEASASDCIVLVLAISLVWTTEALNTSIENLCDLYSTDYDPRIAKIKDIGAAAVLVSALAASVCGLLVFVPLIFGT